MKTILTVDDSASVRQVVKIALGGAGYAVIEAGDGREGLAKAKSHSIQLIITDLNMPGMDGLDFIRSLRLLPPYRGVPIVFLTTESDEGMKQEAKAAGATGWITKPFKQEQLVAVDKEAARMTANSDPSDIFRQEASELLEKLEQALLDLERSPADHDLINTAFRALHTIKGSGAMFGFDAGRRLRARVRKRLRPRAQGHGAPQSPSSSPSRSTPRTSSARRSKSRTKPTR